MFLPIPDVDYVYCRETDFGFLRFAPTSYVRFCHRTWEVVHTATSWDELVDRLTAIDADFVKDAFEGDVDEYFAEHGIEHGATFPGAEALDGMWIGSRIPHGFPDMQPYMTWDTLAPPEIIAIAETKLGIHDVWCELPEERLLEALEIIRQRGETAVEDCALLYEFLDMSNSHYRQSA